MSVGPFKSVQPAGSRQNRTLRALGGGLAGESRLGAALGAALTALLGLVATVDEGGGFREALGLRG